MWKQISFEETALYIFKRPTAQKIFKSQLSINNDDNLSPVNSPAFFTQLYNKKLYICGVIIQLTLNNY